MNQGEVGRIYRMARVGSIDYISYNNVSCHISNNVGVQKNGVTIPSTPIFGVKAGFPACVLVSKICSVVQQGYLDSHRARLQNIDRFDIASSFIIGES